MLISIQLLNAENLYEFKESIPSNEKVQSMENDSTDHLIRTASEYLNFVHDVGSVHSVQPDDPRIELLFSEHLTKIDNRTILFENSRQSLLPQMRGFKKEYDPEATEAAWAVDIANALIIPSVETNTVVIHFEWKHMNVGIGTTTVILQCNYKGQIETIIDVWAPVLNN